MNRQIIVRSCWTSQRRLSATAVSGSSQRRLTGQEILDPLHVDFHVADLDRVLDVGVCDCDRGEDLLRYPWDQALEFGIIDVCALSRP